MRPVGLAAASLCLLTSVASAGDSLVNASFESSTEEAAFLPTDWR